MQGNRHWTGGGKTGCHCPVGQVNIKLVSVVVKIEIFLHRVATAHSCWALTWRLCSKQTDKSCLEFLLFWWEEGGKKMNKWAKILRHCYADNKAGWWGGPALGFPEVVEDAGLVEGHSGEGGGFGMRWCLWGACIHTSKKTASEVKLWVFLHVSYSVSVDNGKPTQAFDPIREVKKTSHMWLLVCP